MEVEACKGEEEGDKLVQGFVIVVEREGKRGVPDGDGEEVERGGGGEGEDV